MDFHIHSGRSVDSKQRFRRILKTAFSRGLDAIVIVDHNDMGGVDDLWTAYDEVFSTVDFDDRPRVFRGAEYSTEQGHIVVAGVTQPLESILQYRIGERVYDAMEIVQSAHHQGGIAIMAHPFRNRKKHPSEELLKAVDAIEGYNARTGFVWRNFGANQHALDVAKSLGKPIVGGSDAHTWPEIGRAGVTIGVSKKLFDICHLSTYDMSVYGRPTPPFVEVYSRLVQMKKTKCYRKIGKQIIKALYGLIIWVFSLFFRKFFLRIRS